MPMPMNQLLSKLRALEAAVPDDVRNDPRFGGLRLDPEGSQCAIAIPYLPPANAAIAGPIDKKLFEDSEVFRRTMEKNEILRMPGSDHSLQLHLQLLAGSAGDGIYPANNDREVYSTLGWVFRLNGNWVGMGSRHGLYPEDDASNYAGTKVYLRQPGNAADPEIGSLLEFEPDEPGGPRRFDCALIALADSPVGAGLGQGLAWFPPKKLGSVDDFQAGRSFRLVGAGSAGATPGMTFGGVGSRKVTWNDGTWTMFCEQLFFEPCQAHAGDSGAVIVAEQSQSAIGLVLAREGRFTVANPIYTLPWEYRGTDSGLPIFSAD